MTMLADWKDVLHSRKISLRKTRGQNFLADPGIAKRIVDLLCLNSGDVVLEIGPGLGALTGELVQRAAFVMAVEIENAFCDALNEWFGGTGRLEVLPLDVLDVDFPMLLEELQTRCEGAGTLKVVSNLPYYISTPILTRLVQAGRFSGMVLTMQKEVAQRITAVPGGKVYGSLSVFTQYFCRAKIEFKISGGAFFPPPKVDSSVVSFTPWDKPPVLVLDKDLFFQVVRASFSARRKTLRNSLASYLTGLGLDKKRYEALLEQCGIDGRRRAETLTMPEFARLANLCSQWLGR